MMIRFHSFGLALTLFIAGISTPVSACTVFSAARGGRILAAKNMDFNNLNTRMLFLPPEDGIYGRMYVGYQLPEGFCNTSGMNDQGLWYAGASLPERSDIYNHYNKPRLPGKELCEKALEECATVEEVIQLYSEYYEPFWNGHSMWADRHGNSVVFEYAETDVVFLHRRGDYQVMSNYYLVDTTNARWYTCYRYQAADHLLRTSDTISLDLFRTIADVTHQEGSNPTLLTSIHDLVNGDIYAYNFHDYKEVLRFNLAEELAQGGGYIALPELFNQLRLRSPAPAEIVDPTAVTFEWYGEAEAYQVYCSTDPDFTDCEPVDVAAASWLEAGLALCALPLGLILIGRRKKWAARLAALALIALLAACEISSPTITSPYAPSSREHSVTLTGLQPGALYYWKVVALGDEGINTESTVRTFLTAE